MKHAMVIVLVLFAVPVCAETFTWDCNPEPDMMVYRGERANSGTGQWGILFTEPHVQGCTTLSWTNPYVVVPGPKDYRLFAIDQVGHESTSSAIVTHTIVVPPPPVVVKPGDVAGFAAGSITQDSAIISGTVPDGAKINLRYMKAPLSWGAATSAACESLPCTITGLTPDTAYQAQCIPYFGAMNQGAIYGNFCPTVTIKTLPAPAPVPPPDLEPRMKAIQDRLDGIEEMGAVLDAEMQEVRGTMRALCRALKGNCP